MTQNEIIEMARQAGAHDNGYEVRFVEPKYLERFAKLIAEKERDKFCASLRQFHDSISLASDSNAIRARGQS